MNKRDLDVQHILNPLIIIDKESLFQCAPPFATDRPDKSNSNNDEQNREMSTSWSKERKERLDIDTNNVYTMSIVISIESPPALASGELENFHGNLWIKYLSVF